jgi:putative tryptophan/tyrosine transport system substrate-binding protein
MRRRDFITLLSGAATWSLAARAQQPERMRRVGVLMPSATEDSEAKARVAAFLQGLQELGWTDGHNIRLEYRWGSGDAGRVPKYAEELVALAPDAILAQGSSTAGPLLQATRAIPIIFVIVPDASKYQLVINLRTAKTLGLTILPSVVARADEVIE